MLSGSGPPAVPGALKQKKKKKKKKKNKQQRQRPHPHPALRATFAVKPFDGLRAGGKTATACACRGYHGLTSSDHGTAFCC